MIIGMLTGAALVIIGILIGIRMQLPGEEPEESMEYPTTIDGKYYSARVALRQAMGESEE